MKGCRSNGCRPKHHVEWSPREVHRRPTDWNEIIVYIAIIVAISLMIVAWCRGGN